MAPAATAQPPTSEISLLRQDPAADRPRESPTPCTINVSIAPDFFDGKFFDDQKMHDLSGLLDIPALYGFPPVLASVKEHAEEKVVVVILCKRSSRTCLPKWRALECGSFFERLSGDKAISCYHAYGVDVDAIPVVLAKTRPMETVGTNCKRKPYARVRRSSFRRMCCGSALC